MWHLFSAARSVYCSLKLHHVVILAVASFTAVQSGQSAAQPPEVTLTQIGSPIWRPADFQVFSAPGYTEEDRQRTRGAIRPRDRAVEPYTTPHGPPYDSELSTDMAAAGFVSRSVFPREAIMGNPNVIHRAFLLLPDPGITGSSRDFASGPVIPNSFFPITSSAELWKDGALAFDHGDAVFEVRPTDQPFEGTSHRTVFGYYWDNGAENVGNYEYRGSLRDTQGNGWDWVALFKVVAELPPGDFNQDGTVDAADYVVWRKGVGTTYTQDDYDAWRANFGTSLLAGNGSAIPSAESLPAVPEPATLMIICIVAIGISATRRAVRRGGLPCSEFRRNSVTCTVDARLTR
jgi:hypothetical protein